MLDRRISHYRLIERLGKGGMGEVWLAEDVRLHFRVALKFLRPDLAADQAAKTRFLREAQAVAQLDHPNIVNFLGFDEADGETFLVTAYLSGGSLRRKLAEADNRPLAWRDVLSWSVQAADGLAAAHRRGVLHRDIKPDNLLLSEEGVLQIVDFGLAQLDEATVLTGAGAIMGTPWYMSPEQLRGQRLDARADLFSLGVTMYELLMGDPPFKTSDHSALLTVWENEVPEPVEQIGEDLPHGLVELIRRLISSDRDRRPGSALEVASALRSIIENRELSRTVVLPRPSLYPRRVRALAMALIVVLSLVLLWRPAIVPTWEKTRRIVGAWVEPRASVSIAVMPFEFQSDEPEDAYLAYAVANGITVGLSRLEGLRIIAPTAASSARDRAQGAEAICRLLGVETLVDGTVTVEGGRIQIRASATNGKDDTILWSGERDGLTTDIPTMQAQLTGELAALLGASLADAAAHSTTSVAPNPELSKNCMKGNYFLTKFSEQELRQARDLFQRAIDLDPTYAPAWAGLSQFYMLTTIYGLLPGSLATTRGIAAAERALEYDDSIASAHAALGVSLLFADGDLGKIEAHLRRGLELDPSDTWAHLYLGIFLMAVNRHDQAVDELRRTAELDPLSLFHQASTLGWGLLQAGRDEELIEFHESTILPVFGENPESAWQLTHAYAYRGNTTEALRWAESGWSFLAWNDSTLADDADRIFAVLLAAGYALLGHDRAKILLRDLETDADASIAGIYAALGESDRAIELLEQNRSDVSFLFGNAHRIYDPLLDDPRYRTLLKDAGVPLKRDSRSR